MKNPGTPGVSVIIPVYNPEDYLRQCLDSAVNQTLRDLEIICVNDGSTDDSAAVLEEYQAKDPRIIVVSQKNLGLSASRNRGMKMARGTYIYFLDSDDEVDLQTLERCTELAEEQREAMHLQEEIGKTYASWTYRIGHAATWLPRKMRDRVRWLKEQEKRR